MNPKNSLFIFFFALFTLNLNAQSDFKLKISGEIEKPLEFTLADLAKMPRKNATVKNKEGKENIYNGVPILEILGKAGVPTGKALHGKEELSKYVLIKCADGYQVLYSLAELDPSIQDKNVIIADQIDGEPLFKEKGPLRIIAEGEKKPARSSYQVTEIVIGSVK